MIRTNNTKDIVNRTQMEFLNFSRNCTILKDTPEMTIADTRIGPFSVGTQVSLPNWIIEKLVLHNYAEIDPIQEIASINNLQDIARHEEDSPHKLQTFHPLLYSAINRKKLNLQSDRSSLDPRLYDEIEKLERMLPVLLESRLTKITRVAKSGALQDKRKDMTLEERWLCEEIANLISDWRKTLFS